MNNYLLTKTGLLAAFAVTVFIISFFRSILKKYSKETPQNSLERKFSLGEIDAYEYEQRKRKLQRDEDLKIKMFFLSRM